MLIIIKKKNKHIYLVCVFLIKYIIKYQQSHFHCVYCIFLLTLYLKRCGKNISLSLSTINKRHIPTNRRNDLFEISMYMLRCYVDVYARYMYGMYTSISAN